MAVMRVVSEQDCATCPHYMGPMRGVGDMISKVTVVTGINTVVQAVAPNCGCAGRRAALNAAMPFADTSKKEQPNGTDI